MIQIFFYQNLNNNDGATDELKKEDEDGKNREWISSDWQELLADWWSLSGLMIGIVFHGRRL